MASNSTQIFLSHAAPEDNDFTRWLAAKLSVSGYDVWCDFHELKGGDLFWEKIEAAIRSDAFRMVAIVSPVSYLKDGVRKEWALAATIEKRVPGFVIPVRVGNFDYNELPILLHQKNVVDFQRGWHSGLAQLLDALQTAKAPRTEGADASGAVDILLQGQSLAVTLVDRTETLESSWLTIDELPPAIEVSQILSTQRAIKLTEANRRLPWFEIEDRIVGFAKRADMAASFKDQVPIQSAEAYSTEEFLSGNVSFRFRVDRQDAQNRVTYLLHQAWDLYAESKGLVPYSMSGGATAWYVPLDLLSKNKAAFEDVDGQVRRRQLAGTSKKYNVNWHYGMTAFAVLGTPRRLELHSHVVFSEFDGTLVDANRMHKLRRSFCKSWWNDRWRGFIRAFLAHLAGGAVSLDMPVGSQRFVRYSALPVRFLSPVGLSDLAPAVEEDDIELEESESEVDATDDEEQGAGE